MEGCARGWGASGTRAASLGAVVGIGLLAVSVGSPAHGAAPLAYVTDLSNTVTVVDTATNTVTGTITPPISASFVGVAVSPDGSRLYLADANHTIAVVTSPADNPSFARINLDESLTPIGLAVTPDGSQLYAANANSNTLTVIDTVTQAVGSIDIPCNQSGTDNCN